MLEPILSASQRNARIRRLSEKRLQSDMRAIRKGGTIRNTQRAIASARQNPAAPFVRGSTVLSGQQGQAPGQTTSTGVK